MNLIDAKETMIIASTISNNIPDKRLKIKATGREKDVKNIYCNVFHKKII